MRTIPLKYTFTCGATFNGKATIIAPLGVAVEGSITGLPTLNTVHIRATATGRFGVYFAHGVVTLTLASNASATIRFDASNLSGRYVINHTITGDRGATLMARMLVQTIEQLLNEDPAGDMDDGPDFDGSTWDRWEAERRPAPSTGPFVASIDLYHSVQAFHARPAAASPPTALEVTVRRLWEVQPLM